MADHCRIAGCAMPSSRPHRPCCQPRQTHPAIDSSSPVHPQHTPRNQWRATRLSPRRPGQILVCQNPRRQHRNRAAALRSHRAPGKCAHWLCIDKYANAEQCPATRPPGSGQQAPFRAATRRFAPAALPIAHAAGPLRWLPAGPLPNQLPACCPAGGHRLSGRLQPETWQDSAAPDARTA